MKKLMVILIFVLLSCDNREVAKIGDVVTKEHWKSGNGTAENYYFIREVQYTDGTSGLRKYEVTMDEYYQSERKGEK